MAADPIVIRNPKAFQKAQDRKQRRAERVNDEVQARNKAIAKRITEYVSHVKCGAIYARYRQQLLSQLLDELIGTGAAKLLPSLEEGIAFAKMYGLLDEDEFVLDGETYVAFSVPEPCTCEEFYLPYPEEEPYERMFFHLSWKSWQLVAA